MDQRICPACGEQFTPTHPSQRACPPTAEDRARQRGQARSQCARKLVNAKHRGRPIVVGRVGEPYDCVQCGKHCFPGENVAPQAERFCGQQHKRDWHHIHSDGRPDRLDPTAGPTRSDIAAYGKAMKADPCAYCGESSEARDHIIPKADGGPDDWMNRTGACHRCNSTKQQTPLLIFLAWKQAREAFEPWRAIVADIHTRPAPADGWFRAVA